MRVISACKGKTHFQWDKSSYYVFLFSTRHLSECAMSRIHSDTQVQSIFEQAVAANDISVINEFNELITVLKYEPAVDQTVESSIDMMDLYLSFIRSVCSGRVSDSMLMILCSSCCCVVTHTVFSHPLAPLPFFQQSTILGHRS